MKKLFFAALAGTILFACQKPDVTPGGDAQAVSITIKTATSTTRAALGDHPVEKDDVTEIKNGSFYFFNENGARVFTYKLTAENIASIADDSKGEITVTDVPVYAKSVAMVANTTTETAEIPANFGKFKDLTLKIASQASMAGANNGENDSDSRPAAIQGIALVDACGAGDSANGLDGTDEIRTASITLTPAVARIEIGTVGILPGTANTIGLESFTLNGVYINKYMQEMKLNWNISGEYSVGQDAGLNWLTKYTTGTPATPATPETPATPAIPGADVNLYTQKDEAVSTETGSQGYAFHVFPGENMPHIVLRGADFKYKDATANEEGPNYWVVTEYYKSDNGAKGDPITKFEPATVYKIESILVGQNFPHDNPYDGAVSVAVTVTVAAWGEQAVYVEPK